MNKKNNLAFGIDTVLDLLDADNNSPTTKSTPTTPANKTKDNKDQTNTPTTAIEQPKTITESTKVRTTTTNVKPTKKKRVKKAADKEQIIQEESIKQLAESISVFDCIKTFTRAFTNSSYFTSVRVFKKKRAHLSLLYPDLTFIEIIDMLITNCLKANKEQLKAAIEEQYPSDW